MRAGAEQMSIFGDDDLAFSAPAPSVVLPPPTPPIQKQTPPLSAVSAPSPTVTPAVKAAPAPTAPAKKSHKKKIPDDGLGHTPLMRQYNEIKSRFPDTLLLYRMGDFYEFFDEDARIASKILGITLTARYQGGPEDTQLAGFPYHALDRYANKLVRAGYKIAICEQTEDPKQAKGLVKRDVVEVITAGTATEDSYIEERANNFIVGVYFLPPKKSASSKRPSIAAALKQAAVSSEITPSSESSSSISTTSSSASPKHTAPPPEIINDNAEVCGLAVCDLSTGFFQVEEVSRDTLEHELVRIDPGEILVSPDQTNLIESYIRSSYRKVYVSRYDGWKFDADTAAEAITSHFGVASVQGLGLEGLTSGVCAAGALIRYLKEQKKSDLRHITAIAPREIKEFAELDPSTIRNLELFKPMSSDDTEGALINVIDCTSTGMGARLLRRWLAHPLRSATAINERLDCVEWFKNDTFVRGEMELLLRTIADLERLISRVTFERANARDLNALRRSFEAFPKLQRSMAKCALPQVRYISDGLSGFEEMAARITHTIVDEPPLSVKDGGIIKSGVDKTLDDLRGATVDSKQWVAKLQETERERTGITTLKVGYNKVFGYYIEIPTAKANKAKLPSNYFRKQTLSTGERFVTPELKHMEEKILGAGERMCAIEYDIFAELRGELSRHCERIQRAALSVSTIDVFISLARIAAENAYCRPVLCDDAEIIIKDGRHPVVEKLCAGEEFVPNDTDLSGDSQVALITGPNMAGKSTYLRQTALIAIMAQIGSFVPAASAKIGIVDKFFTRVGASDRLARGQSTFLVEMIEVANILNNATDRSLVLLDEVGRGTSTFDGISIAWAVAEYLHDTQGRRARTLFATHYHELTEMPLIYPRIKNLHVKVKEWNDQIIFLRKIDTGSCDHSYGIQVARLAGVPTGVIVRAREILNNLENMELTPDHKPVLARKKDGGFNNLVDEAVQTNIIDEQAASIVTRLRSIDINAMTPIDAMNIIFELRKKAFE